MNTLTILIRFTYSLNQIINTRNPIIFQSANRITILASSTKHPHPKHFKPPGPLLRSLFLFFAFLSFINLIQFPPPQITITGRIRFKSSKMLTRRRSSEVFEPEVVKKVKTGSDSNLKEYVKSKKTRQILSVSHALCPGKRNPESLSHPDAMLRANL